MTKSSDVKLTAEQQLDVLWALMTEHNVLVGVARTGDLVIHPVSTGNDSDIKGQTRFIGTREKIIEQLCARQVAARLQA